MKQPGKKSSKPATPGRGRKTLRSRHRFWLMYPPRLITVPVIWQLGHKFAVVTNVRQASVTDEIGVVCLEIEGAERQILRAVRWLERLGVKVEPVEINVIES